MLVTASLPRIAAVNTQASPLNTAAPTRPTAAMSSDRFPKLPAAACDTFSR